MEIEIIKKHSSLQSAFDIAIWMNFIHQDSKRTYGVIKLKKSKQYKVVQTKGIKKSRLFVVPTDYSQMTYEQIKTMCESLEPLEYWDDIISVFSKMNPQLLRFIILYKVPLEKLIRYNLSCLGIDKNNDWVGYDKSERIWIK